MLMRLLLGCCLTLSASQVGARDLSSALQQLADRHQFRVVGLKRVGDAPAPSVANSAPLPIQVRELLRGFAYVLESGANGRVSRLVVLGPNGKAPVVPKKPAADTIEVPLTGEPGNKRVVIDISGPSGSVNWPMLVDTGATLVVLPAKLAGRVGIELPTGWLVEMNTASGKMTGQRAVLKEMRVAGHTIENVDAVFVESETLEDFGLLGMSVLNRYKIELDGEDTLRLSPREEAKSEAEQ